MRVWNQAAENETSPGGTGAWCHSGGGDPTNCCLGAHAFQEQLPRARLCCPESWGNTWLRTHCAWLGGREGQELRSPTEAGLSAL